MLLARVRRTLLERGLLEPGARVLVACSGGADSTALLHLLCRLADELSLTLHAASVDHGLRADARIDVGLARTHAARLGVPFAALRVAIEGPSLQARAREARYAALHAEAARIGAARIAVGHTRDDQAETVLARLLRGAGVTGLAGVAPMRRDGVIRPLIDCERAEVRAHVARNGLPYRDDPSNVDPSYERARVRARVLPALEAEDARVVEHLADLADEAREIAAWIDEESSRLVERGSTRLDPDRLREAPGPVRRAALAAWVRSLTGRTARRAHVEALERMLSRGEGDVLIGGGWRVRADGHWTAVHDPGHPSRSHRPEK